MDESIQTEAAAEPIIAVEQAQAPAAPASSHIEQAIETWLHDLLESLPHLRETQTYNRLREATGDLKKRLT